MVKLDTFQEYFERSQELAFLSHCNPTRLPEFLAFIDLQGNSSIFKGEHAFYNKKYRYALQCYLQEPNNPYFKLFCYRASAYVSKEAGDHAKSIDFAEKALGIFSEDYASMLILEALLKENNKNEAAELIKEKRCVVEQKFSYLLEKDKTEQTPQHDDNATDIQAPQASEDQKTPYIPTRQELEQIIPSPIVNETAKNNHENQSSQDQLNFAVQAFRSQQSRQVEQYLERYRKRPPLNEHSLYVLHGWHPSCQQDFPMLLVEQARRPSGGFFIRWEGRGIVVNPGEHFLEFFHEQGLHIRDIDYVIVTSGQPECYSDVQKIYSLNSQFNKELSELQIIHYYLCHEAYQSLSRKIKPNFKQERNTLHCLELFVDSPEIEQIEIDTGISIEYFSLHPNYSGEVGIALQLTSQNHQVRIGLLQKNSHSSIPSVGKCDILISTFGHTDKEDSEENPNLSNMHALLESIQPRLLLCSEFDGQDGDIRLESIGLLRECYTSSNIAPTILAADTGFFLDLATFEVRCTHTKVPIDLPDVRIIKPAERFGRLQYVSPKCVI